MQERNLVRKWDETLDSSIPPHWSRWYKNVRTWYFWYFRRYVYIQSIKNANTSVGTKCRHIGCVAFVHFRYFSTKENIRYFSVREKIRYFFLQERKYMIIKNSKCSKYNGRLKRINFEHNYLNFNMKLQGHWWGFISRNYVVWPTFFLMNVFIALKGTNFWFLFAFTAAGVVQCGGRKTSPRTSTIVQFIIYFWSFEISVNMLRNQK